MTRREFLALPAVGIAPVTAAAPLVVPVRLIMDARANLDIEEQYWFRSSLWPPAVRDFAHGGIHLGTSQGAGEVSRPPGRAPVLDGLERGVVNLVITGQIPMQWDSGRALSGVTMLYRGFHVCMVALYHAHGNQIPFFSVNTCVHELLHALLLDIYESRPDGVAGQAREFRVDCCATRLWLFHDGSAIRPAARIYVERLRAEAAGAAAGAKRASVVPQSLDRIDRHGAARGNPARQ